MADYQARINLLVTGQNRLRDVQTQLQQIEQTITDLERRQRVAGAAAARSRTIARAIGGTEQPRAAGGRFAADPNRQQRFAILAAERRLNVETRLARLLTSRARAEADGINTRIAGQNRINRRVEAQITLESRLNAAVDLYRTNLQKFERAGGTTNVALNRQVTTIRDAFAAFEAGGSRNLRLVRALATELGRVGEAQREINRTQSLGSKGFEAGRRLQERLTVVGQSGVTDPAQIRRVRSLATEAIAASRTGDQQAYQEAIRRATAATARLERESRETAQALNAATKGYASSPLRGTATMPGSPAFLAAQGQRRSAVRGRIGGAVSGAAIGGAFPLLFGQGAGAAAGGAIGGLAGGLAGPGGSFAGSLIGTLLGDIVSKGNVVKKLGEDIGFSAQQTKTLETAFKQAGSEFEKFQASVQNIRGLGLDIEAQAESIKLVSTLTEKYGGTIDKVTNAFTSALESGKVTQATLNQLTSQGIPIQQALADKYKVSRSELLQMAKDGKISIQDLTDTLVEVGNRGVEATTKTENGFTRLGKETKNLGGAFQDLAGAIVKALSPAFEWLADKIAGIISLAAQGVNAVARMFSGGTANDVTASARAGAQLVKEFPELRSKTFGGRTGKSVVSNNTLAVGATAALDPAQKARYDQLRSGVMTTLEKPETIKPIDVTGLGQLPPSGGGKSAADKAAEDAAREAARVAELVRDRQLATLELQRQAVFSQKIAEAEMAKDSILVRQLQGQQEIMQLGIQTASELEKEKNSMAQLAIAREFQAKKALALLGIELDIAKIKQEQTEQYNTIISDLDTELALKYAITEQERTQLRIAAEMRKLRLSDPYLTEPQLMQIQQGKERLAAPKTGAELIAERSGALEDELKALTDSGNQAITIATGIGDAFSNSFKGIIDGSMTAREALAGFFQSVADQFLDMAAQIIAKWIQMTILNSILKLFPGGAAVGDGLGSVSDNVAAYSSTGIEGINIGTFGGARANGGPVSGGQMYMVGERGPELFVPGRSGTIVPNDKMGGGGGVNVVVNVDAKGSNVAGNDQDANQLGRVISAAVQSELIKQQRPGGLLTR